MPTLTGVLPDKTKIVIAPAEVQLKGVQAELRKITSVVTEPINIEQLKMSGKLTVPVVIKPDGIRIDSIDPVQVTRDSGGRAGLNVEKRKRRMAGRTLLDNRDFAWRVLEGRHAWTSGTKNY